jgi:hypothetical protein
MHSVITEVLAALLILLSLAKLAVVLVNARAWLGFAKRLYANPQVTSGVALVVAGVILSLLIRSGLDIVQILAVCLFVVCLMVAGVAPYAPHLFAWFETQDVGQLIKRQWLYVSVWIALLVWGAYTLLA